MDYETRDGTIVQPGKFEGQPAYAPHFWGLALEGDGMSGCEATGDDGPEWTRVSVTADDRELYPELAGTDYVYLCESDDGFVTCSLDGSGLTF